MQEIDRRVEYGKYGVHYWIFYFYFYFDNYYFYFYFIIGILNNIKNYVFIFQKSVLQKLGIEASKIIFQK